MLALALLSATLFTLSALWFTLHQGIRLGSDRLGADAIVMPAGWPRTAGGPLLAAEPAPLYLDETTLQSVLHHEGVASATAQLFIVSADLACCSVANTILTAYDPATDFTITPWIKRRLNRPASDDEIIAGSGILSEPGGRIRFFGKLFTIVAKLEPTGLPIMDNAVFITMHSARDMIRESAEAGEITLTIAPTDISGILVRFSRDADPGRTAVMLQLALPEAEVILASAALSSARRTLSAPLRLLSIAGIAQWIAGLALIALLFALSVGMRAHEIRIMKALGASSQMVFSVFLLEVLMLSTAGAALGLIAGNAGLEAMGGILTDAGLTTMTTQRADIAAGAFLLSILATLSVTIIPIRRALKFYMTG